MDAVTRLLADLVALPSLNPMGRPVVDPATMLEGRVTNYLEAFFRDLGVRHERRPVAAGRDNLLAWYDAPGTPPRTLLFDAHQDTVPADGMVIDPFGAQIRGDRLHGRGACDVKGGLAAMLMAFARLVKERPAGSASVILACTADEEYTHLGSSALATQLGELKPDLAIVAEPTMLHLVNCHKGAVRWKVVAKGIACHSSTPQLGDNAIYRIARVVSALAEHAAELAQADPHPILGPPSLSVGRVEGGVAANVVPDVCIIEVDRRVLPGETPLACLARAGRFLEDRLGPDPLREFLPPWVTMPALGPEASAPFLPALRDAVASALGRPTPVGGVPYGTDAGPLAEAGLPAVVLGPGDIARAHTEDEWIELDQLRAAVDVYYAIARGL